MQAVDTEKMTLYKAKGDLRKQKIPGCLRAGMFSFPNLGLVSVKRGWWVGSHLRRPGWDSLSQSLSRGTSGRK